MKKKMKNFINYSFILFIGTLGLSSCSDDNGGGQTNNPTETPMVTIVFDGDQRTYPLVNSADGNYTYRTSMLTLPAQNGRIEQYRFSIEIFDRNKQYIGDIGGYAGTKMFDLTIATPVYNFTETPKTFDIKENSFFPTETQAGFGLSFWENGSGVAIASFDPLAGQKVTIYKKNNVYYVDISNIKFNDNVSRDITMTGLKFEAKAS